MNRNLSELREEISKLDRALLELLERRFLLAAEVGRLKAEQNQPVTVQEVERRVLGRAREAAQACGVSPEVMEAIFRAIIRGSVERQYRVGIERRARGGKRLVVLGAAGAMGSWLQGFLESIGHQVEGVDTAWKGLPPAKGRFAALEEVENLDGIDGLFVSTPLDTTVEVLNDLAGRGITAPIFEIASIKSHLAESLMRLREVAGPVYSIHPMFGPGKSPYESLTVIHAVLADEDAEREAILQLLAHPYLNLISMPFDRHDRIAGWLLGLSHLTGMLFATALSRSGANQRELEQVASTSFSRQAATSRSVLEGNSRLFYSIQRLNPHRGAVYAALNSALGELTGAVEGEDPEAFASTLARAEAMLPE
jgi:prephenate dehydrogenase/chorismate mutase